MGFRKLQLRWWLLPVRTWNLSGRMPMNREFPRFEETVWHDTNSNHLGRRRWFCHLLWSVGSRIKSSTHVVWQSDCLCFSSVERFREELPTYDFELAEVVALKMWRHYQYGVHCYIYIDHKNLEHTFTPKGNTWWFVVAIEYSWVKIGRGYDRLHVGITEVVKRLRFYWVIVDQMTR